MTKKEVKQLIKNDLTLCYYTNNSNYSKTLNEEIEKYKLENFIKKEFDIIFNGLIPINSITNNTYNFYNYIFNKYKLYLDNNMINKFNEYLNLCTNKLIII